MTSKPTEKQAIDESLDDAEALFQSQKLIQQRMAEQASQPQTDQKYVVLDAAGQACAFYFASLHGTSVPANAKPITDAEYAAFLAPKPPAPETAEQVQNRLSQTLQNALEAGAHARGYGSILSLCSYASSRVKHFAAEAQAGMDWRDAVWAYGAQLRSDVLAGKRGVPTAEELLKAMPTPKWPADEVATAPAPSPAAKPAKAAPAPAAD